MTAPIRSRIRSADGYGVQVLLRASDEQRTAWRAASERAGLSLSEWLRRLADLASGYVPERGGEKKDRKSTRGD